MRVFQHIDSWKRADGIGADAYGLAQIFSDLGLPSYIVTRTASEFLRTPLIQSISIPDIPSPNINDIHVLHYGGTGYPLDFYISLPGRKVLRFHNFTPAYFFDPKLDEDLAMRMQDDEVKTEIELESLGLHCESAWCDSTFNAELLDNYSFKRVILLPICKKFKILQSNSNLPSNLNLGFVSRFSPQKKWENLFEVFHVWNAIFPNSQLDCVGSIVPAFSKYFDYLLEEVKNRNLTDKINFHFNTDDEQIEILRQKWFATVCLSEHEGFCLPLLESFGAGTLTLFYLEGAMRETSGGKGLLLKEKNPLQIAYLLKYFRDNPSLYQQIANAQLNRVEKFNETNWSSIVEKELNYNI